MAGGRLAGAEAVVAEAGRHVTGTMLCSRHALGPMIEQKGGRIINLSSQPSGGWVSG